MKQWLLVLVTLLVWTGFLSGCSSDGDGITSSSNIAGSQAVSREEGTSLEPQAGGPAGPPPQEAFDACVGKNEGDAAELTAPNGETISGTCQRIEDQLLLVPEGGQHGPHPDREPPQEAFEACEGKSEGAMGELTAPNGDTITGSCQMIEDQLVLIPENGRAGGPPPRGE